MAANRVTNREETSRDGAQRNGAYGLAERGRFVSLLSRGWTAIEFTYKLHVLWTVLVALGLLALSVPLTVGVVWYHSIQIQPSVVTVFILSTYAVVWFVAVNTTLRFRRARKSLRAKSQEYDRVAVEVDKHVHALREREQFVDRYETFERSFGGYSYYNAQNEKNLFDCLYGSATERGTPVARLHSEERLVEADRIIAYNLGHIATSAATLLAHLAGSKCATSIKLIDNLSTAEDDLADAKLRVLIRDASSRPTRGTHEIIYRASENTGIEQVVVHKAAFYAKEDLLGLSKSGHYRNPRPGWQTDYNATIVVPIRKLNETSHETGIRGVFCADYMGAQVRDDRLSEPNFTSRVCRELMIGMSYRIATLLYRLDRIKADLDRLERG